MKDKFQQDTRTKEKEKMGKSKKISTGVYALAVIIPYLIMAGVIYWHNKEIDKIKTSKFIVISKEDMQLTVYGFNGDKLFEAPIAVGTGFGNKEKVGDRKTPEGVFRVVSVEDASTWVHDFNDGKGVIQNAYGPYFIRLEVPGQKGIGIHGTHDPNSIGTRATEGCVRLRNEDIAQLADMVGQGTMVIIGTSKLDVMKADSLQKIIEETGVAKVADTLAKKPAVTEAPKENPEKPKAGGESKKRVEVKADAKVDTKGNKTVEKKETKPAIEESGDPLKEEE